jgi:hypothetical protein
MSLFPMPQLDHTDQNTFDTLVDQWAAKQSRNKLRSMYYDIQNPMKDLGISIPPQLRSLELALGWPAKGVNGLARRCNYDKFVIPGQVGDPYGLSQVMTQNSMDQLIPQAITSAMIHSTSFIETTQGDTAAGEPDVLITVRSALDGTGVWDNRRQALSSALAVSGADESGIPTEFVMYVPGRVLTMRKTADKWRVWQQTNRLPHVPVEPLVYQPELGRPFGHSRISRAAMALTDSALRTMLRGEVMAEFFTAPQRYLLGADESAFQDADGNTASQWKAVMGRFLAIGPGEEGDPVPTLDQFPQVSMEPHFGQLRQLATLFAAEMNLPVGSMGIVQDNPSSAEAIAAAEKELVIEADAANRSFGAALARTGRTAVMLRDGLSSVPTELYGLRVNFRDPATPTRSATADYIQKMVQTFPNTADSPVWLEQLGFDATTVDRLVADARRGRVSSLAQNLRATVDTLAVANPDAAVVAGARGAGE